MEMQLTPRKRLLGDVEQSTSSKRRETQEEHFASESSPKPLSGFYFEICHRAGIVSCDDHLAWMKKVQLHEFLCMDWNVLQADCVKDFLANFDENQNLTRVQGISIKIDKDLISRTFRLKPEGLQKSSLLNNRFDAIRYFDQSCFQPNAGYLIDQAKTLDLRLQLSVCVQLLLVQDKIRYAPLDLLHLLSMAEMGNKVDWADYLLHNLLRGIKRISSSRFVSHLTYIGTHVTYIVSHITQNKTNGLKFSNEEDLPYSMSIMSQERPVQTSGHMPVPQNLQRVNDSSSESQKILIATESNNCSGNSLSYGSIKSTTKGIIAGTSDLPESSASEMSKQDYPVEGVDSADILSDKVVTQGFNLQKIQERYAELEKTTMNLRNIHRKRYEDLCQSFREINRSHNVIFCLKQFCEDKKQQLLDQLQEKESQLQTIMKHKHKVELELKESQFLLQERESALRAQQNMSALYNGKCKEAQQLRKELKQILQGKKCELEAAHDKIREMEQERTKLITAHQTKKSELKKALKEKSQSLKNWQNDHRTLTMKYEQECETYEEELGSLREGQMKLYFKLRQTKRENGHKPLNDYIKP